MKKTLVVLALLASAISGFSQGQVQNINFAGTTYKAPIYGVNPANPAAQVRGQSAAGLPAGAVDYGGAPLLSGTGFTSEVWGGPQGTAEGSLQLGVQPTPTFFRTGAGAGFTLGGAATFGNVPAGSVASMQFRAYDNQNHTILSWAQVMANPTIPHGSSAIFDSPILTVPPTTPAVPTGLTSFNLIVVPEPSLIALGALGLGALLLRRRKA